MSIWRIGTRSPDTIDHKDFDAWPRYYPYLVNDSSPPRPSSTGRTTRATVNTSSLFVIGAGEGATVGALWMASHGT